VVALDEFWDPPAGDPGVGVRRRYAPKAFTPDHQSFHASGACACDPELEYSQLSEDVNRLRSLHF
jgi:hypothetical protein